MEASDAFAQEIEGKDDPFAGEFGEGLEAPGAAEELPEVNREGERIDNGGTPEHPQEEPQAAQAATADPTPPAESAGQTEDPTPATGATETAPAGNGRSGASEPEPTTPSGGEGPPTPAGAEAAAAPDPSEAPPTTGASAGQQSSGSGSATGGDEGEAAAEPQETEDKSGRKTRRKYLVFQVDGPGKLTQVQWYEDKSGKLTQRGAGAKRQNVCLARGVEEALKFGYAAVGSPANGVKLVAVAKLHFQPREVKPTPPEPTRQRLTIS